MGHFGGILETRKLKEMYSVEAQHELLSRMTLEVIHVIVWHKKKKNLDSFCPCPEGLVEEIQGQGSTHGYCSLLCFHLTPAVRQQEMEQKYGKQAV